MDGSTCPDLWFNVPRRGGTLSHSGGKFIYCFKYIYYYLTILELTSILAYGVQYKMAQLFLCEPRSISMYRSVAPLNVKIPLNVKTPLNVKIPLNVKTPLNVKNNLR